MTLNSLEGTSFTCSQPEQNKVKAETKQKMNALLLILFIFPCGKLKVVCLHLIHCPLTP